jgi:CRISPR-associated protein Cas5t
MYQADVVSLKIDVPVCSLRKGTAREYLETEEMPPPSTVYGFLLSLIGEEDRNAYIGSTIACARLGIPELSVVLRTCWRIKDGRLAPGLGNNKRPDFQEVLTGFCLAIWVKPGPLAERLRRINDVPSENRRYGGLSFGESRDLVNEVLWFPDYGDNVGKWLLRNEKGHLPLPVWVDHVGSKHTLWQQFATIEDKLCCPPENDNRWITISSS